MRKVNENGVNLERKKGNEIIIKNVAMLALEEIQDEFEGEAERLNLKDEDDVVSMIKEVRKERKK